MSGRMQHYIPQSFLRGFLISKGSEQTRVYCKDKNYISNINRVAAQRDFYSSPIDDERETLDDVITNYENRLGALLGQLRDIDIGKVVNSSIVAEVVAHLSPRGKNIRHIFGGSTTKIIEGIAEIFSDKEEVLSLLGLNKPSINERWNGNISSLTNGDLALAQQVEYISKQVGIPGKTLDKIIFMHVKEFFLGNESSVDVHLKLILKALISQVDTIISSGHKEALNNGLVAEPRKIILEKLIWRILPAPAEGAIMPDCIAIGFDEDEGIFLPYIITSESSTVIMPLTSEKLLVGVTPDSSVSDLSNFNEEAAKCSSEFFISTSSEHANLSRSIGNHIQNKMDSLVLDTLNNLQIDKELEYNKFITVPSCDFSEYQITFHHWLTEENISDISETFQAIVAELRQSLNLSKLDGITFTSKFEKALEDTERGFDGDENQEVIPDHIAQGAAALLVIRNGELKVRIVLHQDYANALVCDDIQDAVVALYLVVAGLSIVHIVNQFENTIPGFLMEPVMGGDHAAILHCALRKALRAYRYASLSAIIVKDELIEQLFSNYLENAMTSFYENIIRAKAEHKIDCDHEKLFRISQHETTNILIAMARFLGYQHGTGNAALPSSETFVGSAISVYQLAGWFNVFSYDIQHFWNKVLWTREDIYALNIHVERLLWLHNIYLFQTDDGLGTMIFSL